MREPMIRYIQLLKSFDAYNASGKMWSVGWIPNELGQHPMTPPSVFNFFLPSYAPSGPIADSSLVAPEFEMLNSTLAIEYINLVFEMVLGEFYMESLTLASPEDVGYPWWDMGLDNPEDHIDLDLDDEILIASLNVTKLIERLDILMTGGTMSSETKTTIVSIIDVDYIEPGDKLKIAMYLVLISPDYIIQN
jgi:hypothetical protein